MTAPPSTQNLAGRLKDDAERYPESSRVRLHRSLSWLKRADIEKDDLDASYVFLWIAFNAAYAREFGADESERTRLNQFIAVLLEADTALRLHGLLFDKFSGPIRLMIDNKYVFEPFWRALREHDSSGEWERRFDASRKAALASTRRGETATVLSIVFDRLYVLRNQLVHGGATWNSKVNRAQLRDGVNILQALVPLIVELMLDHPQRDFGDVLYPVV